MPILITKSDGTREPYRPEKIRATLARSGARPEIVAHVLEKVTRRVKNGMATRRIHAIVRKELGKEDRCLAHRYNLRDGLLKLGPSGFTFEKYVASILQAYEYATVVPENDMVGLCVKHEIDVMAEKNGDVIMIEAKFRNDFSDTVNLKDVMSTWARFQDLQAGSKKGLCPKFTDVWIVTNGRFSDRAQQFGDCKGIRTVGWSGKEHSLARMVDHQALYPITVLDELQQWELDAFSKKGLLLCRQVAGKDAAALARSVGVTKERAAAIVADCGELVRQPRG
jgi:hypothetical protein